MIIIVQAITSELLEFGTKLCIVVYYLPRATVSDEKVRFMLSKSRSQWVSLTGRERLS